MAEPDMSPVKPYPGYPGLAPEAIANAAGATAPAGRRRPVIEPVNPAEWETTLPLRFPLFVDGEELNTLTIRRVTGDDVAELVMELGDSASLNIRARALAAGVHPDVIAALAADDAEAFAAKVRPFLPAALVALEAQIAEDLATSEMSGAG